MATNLGTAVGYLTLDITGFSRGIDEATREIDRMKSGTESTLSKMGTSATKAGTFLTAAVTAPIVGFGTSVLREGTEFEEAMTQVKNVANLANSNIDEFRAAVADLGYQMTETGDDVQSMFETMYNYAVNQGSETRFTAEEVASALYYMGLAGWEAQDMMRGLRPILDLSAATGEDLARVSDIVTDSMTALGITTEELSDYTNVLAEMTRSSNTTLNQAGEAFKYVAPLAGALGYNMQDISIAIGEFANVGVKGSQAGTGLRQALNSLTNPSDRAKEVLDRLNWSIYDLSGNAKPLMQVMTELRDMFNVTGDIDDEAFLAFTEYLEEAGKVEEFDAMSAREQIEMLSEWASTSGISGEKLVTQYQKVADVIKLVGVRALPGMLGIINETDENFKDLTNSVYGAQESYGGLGTAVGMADELMNTTQGSIYKLTSSISELKIQLFDFLQGPFQSVIDKLTEVVKWFNSLDDATQRNIMNWAGIAAAVGPALLIFGKLLTGISNISTAFSLAGLSKDKFSKNVTGTLNPALGKGEGAFAKLGNAIKGVGTFLASHAKQVGGVTAVVTGAFLSIGSAVEGFKQGGFKFRQWVEDILGGILITVGLFVAGVTGWVPVIIGAVVAAVAAIIGNWEKISGFFKNTVWPGIKNFFSNVENGINNFLAKSREVIGGFIDKVKTGVSNFFSNIREKGSNFISTASTNIGNFLGNTVEKVSTSVSNIWDNVSTFFSNLISDIGAWFSDIFNSLSSLVSEVLNIISQAGQDIMNGIQSVFQTIQSAMEQLGNFFKDIFSNIVSFVQQALSNIGSAITNFISGLINSIKSMIDTIMNFISNLASHIGSALMDIFNAIKSFFEEFISNLGDVLNNIASWLDGLISGISSFVGELWQNLLDMISNFGEGIKNTLGEIGNGITSLVEEVGNGVGSFLEGIGSALGDGLKGIVEKVKQGFSGILNEVFNIGKNIVMGIVNGIREGIDWVGQNASSIFGGLVDFVKNVFKIGSPSKVFADEVGYWLPLGIAKGFDEAVPDALDDINNSIDDIIEGVDSDGAEVNLGVSYMDLQTVLSNSYSAFADTVETTEQRLNASLDSMYEKMYGLVMLERELTNGFITNTGYENSNANATTNGTNGAGNVTNTTTGNTFIFNSPKAIDEIEAARQLERTQRDLEDGFL